MENIKSLISDIQTISISTRAVAFLFRRNARIRFTSRSSDTRSQGV